MTNDIAALIKAKLESDPVLSVSGPKNGKVRVIIAGARLAKNPTPPYVCVNVLSGSISDSMGTVGISIDVYGETSEKRWDLSKRITLVLKERRLAKPGLCILRLMQLSATDNLPDRQFGSVKLCMLFRAQAVLTDALYQ